MFLKTNLKRRYTMMEEIYYEKDLNYHLEAPASGCDICESIAELKQKLLTLSLWTEQSIEEDILPSLIEGDLYEYLRILDGK